MELFYLIYVNTVSLFLFFYEYIQLLRKHEKLENAIPFHI